MMQELGESWSSTTIAEKCGVAKQFVVNVENSQVSTVDTSEFPPPPEPPPQPEKVQGKDGK